MENPNTSWHRLQNFSNLHISIWKYNFSFEEVQFIRFLSKLWTISPTALEQTCTLCLINLINQFQLVVFGWSFTCYIKNSFYDSLINSFDVHLYLELTHLNEDTLFYILPVGIETTTVLEEHEKKDIIWLCAKFCVVSSPIWIELWLRI